MSETRRTAEISEELDGARFDRALAQLFPEFSRSRLKSWVLDGRAVPSWVVTTVQFTLSR